MPANIASTIDPYHQIINLTEYVYLRTVRANTCLIGGKIIYEGKQYNEADYNTTFPEPVLKYDTLNADKTQVEK